MTSRTVRGLTTAAMAGLLLTAAPAAATVRRASSAPTAMLSASPDSNLKDGQQITVTGTDYPSTTSVDLVQCEQSIGCDLSNNVLSQTDANGGYTATFTVHRIITLDNQQVDCVARQDCVLVSVDYVTYSAAAQTAITFDPNAPFTKPVHFRVVPDPTARVRVDKGTVRVTGRVFCNQVVDMSMDMYLTQQYNRQIFESETLSAVSCSKSGRFSAVFRPQNGLFGAGTAKLQIFAYGQTPTSSYNETKHVQLTLTPTAS